MTINKQLFAFIEIKRKKSKKNDASFEKSILLLLQKVNEKKIELWKLKKLASHRIMPDTN